MVKWFRKHKKILLVVGTLIGGPAAGLYIQGADAALEAVEILTAPEPEQKQGGD